MPGDKDNAIINFYFGVTTCLDGLMLLILLHRARQIYRISISINVNNQFYIKTYAGLLTAQAFVHFVYLFYSLHFKHGLW